MFNLGIIVPQSTYLPSLSRDLPIACKMGLENLSDSVNLIFESGGYNEDVNIIKDKVQGMIIRENLDAVLCPLNSSLIEPLNVLCKQEGVALIVNTMGEDVIFKEALSESLFVNSYHLWHSGWLTGHYASSCKYENLAGLYSRHEAGYGVPLAIAVGAESGDANMKLVQVTHRDSSDEDCTELLEELDQLKPDAIITHHFGKEAISFFRDIERAKLKSPIVVLPSVVEDITLNQLGDCIEGVKTVNTFRTDTDSYQSFATEFKKKSGRIAHPHIIMAYESVKLLAKVVADNEEINFENLTSELRNVNIEGPRGEVSFNSDNKDSLSRYFVREASRDESGEIYNKTLNEMDIPKLCHEQYELAQKNTQKQGWVNPYLIA